jgi:cytochrome c
MNPIRTACVAAACALAAGAALANPTLAEQKGCLNCRQIGTKLVGPPYRKVAAKYRKDPAAENRLVKKVLEGSFGAWGKVPMPANQVTEEEARTLVR